MVVRLSLFVIVLGLCGCDAATLIVPDATPARDAATDAPVLVDASRLLDAPTSPDASTDNNHDTNYDCTNSCVTRACAPSCGRDAGLCPITHVPDLADHMPAHLAVMYSMSWFGLPRTSDPNGTGSDPGYGNWRWGGGCMAVNDPRTCASYSGSAQRQIASRHRPLAGIYSSSGRDDESRRRVDLMLSTLRRPCDDGARLDAWSVQIDSIRFSSAHLAEGDAGFSASADFAYRALLTFFDRADAAGMSSVVMVGDDSTWYWHFGGITTQAGRLGALEGDLVEAAAIADTHPSALRIDDRLVLYVYTGGDASGPYISASEWSALLTNVRNRTGLDVYVIGGTTSPAYFTAFDGIAPWIETGAWDATSGATETDHAHTWTHRRHDALLAALPMHPGRVVWGGIAAGFDDYTRDWGACDGERVIPRTDAVLDSQFDVLNGTGVRGMLVATWDDWTEGSFFEPEVAEGAGRLVRLRRDLGSFFGDPVDTAGDQRLSDRFAHYGQARDCSGGSPTLSSVDLACP